MRPGRLDRLIYVGLPDADARLAILRVRTRRMAIDPALDFRRLAQMVCTTAEADELQVHRT